jgi:carboxymethylenebutenolidase
MTDITIDATDGGCFGAYLAEPVGTVPAPAMLVIQEIFGINANMRAICDDYAARGYIAVAPDLFWRQQPGVQLDPLTPEGREKAMAFYKGFSEAKAMDDLLATLAWLRRHPRANGKAGAVGYCLGGKLAFLMAARSGIDASVGYYGVGIEKSLDETAAIARPLMLHIPEEDGACPPEARRQILDALGKIPHATAHVYPGAGHAFARKGGDHYDAEVTRLANQRTAEFFRANL